MAVFTCLQSFIFMDNGEEIDPGKNLIRVKYFMHSVSQ